MRNTLYSTESSPGRNRPFLVAGPCSAESPEQLESIAGELKEVGGVDYFRAGIWKPRTRPGSFEGVGDVGLPWLKEIKEKFQLKVATEVAGPRHLEQALKYEVDAIWIGARTTANPFAVQELAESLSGVDIPVMVKNPINADLGLWIGAIERLQSAGVIRLIGIHRGFSTFGQKTFRNAPLWWIPVEFRRRFPEIPLICDPSHISGTAELVPGVAQLAMDMDMDGLMVEVHHRPDLALSDAAQQITPKNLSQLLRQLEVKVEYCEDTGLEKVLANKRKLIDFYDNELLNLLKMRMEVVKDIGLEKSKHKVTPLQLGRLEYLLKDRGGLGDELGLSTQFIESLFRLIHSESLKVQYPKNLPKF